MKLRNKKTGEIGELQITEKHCAVVVGNGTASCGIAIYNSLADINEDWEDYEEPKDRWYINENGGVLHYVPDDPEGEDLTYNKYQDEIGNYFETKEEAEEAVERLRAWKRLKDEGLKLKMWEWEYIYNDNISGELIIKAHIDDATDSDGKYTKDLDLLFGGEK